MKIFRPILPPACARPVLPPDAAPPDFPRFALLASAQVQAANLAWPTAEVGKNSNPSK